ncbi:hypothetical protein HKD37_06G017061 [Glycine soja]
MKKIGRCQNTLFPTVREIDMAMGWGGDEYCLPNPRPRLPNMSPYTYPILDGLKFIIPFPYPLGIGSGFGVEADALISYPYPYPTFGCRGKPELMPGQLGYYPSKSGQIWTGTHGYRFSCHV